MGRPVWFRTRNSQGWRNRRQHRAGSEVRPGVEKLASMIRRRPDKIILFIRALRTEARKRINEKIDAMIAQGSAQKWSRVQADPKVKQHIAGVQDADGRLRTNRAGIALVFAAFYKSLYEALDEALAPTPDASRAIPPEF